MIRFRTSLLATAVIALAVSIAPAHAQQARSFVSGLGSDTNAPNCTRTAPCRTFQVAHDNTLPSGEITVLDAGSYGAVKINRAISIINDGVGEAGALVSGGGNGITINAGATDAVTLRGLTIKGLVGFGGGNGIVFNTGLSLTIENCVIRSMTGASGVGIKFLANATSAFAVSNTQVTDNQNGGILAVPSGAGVTVTAAFDGVGLYNNGLFGFAINGSNANLGSKVTATITNSVAGSNNGNGFSTVTAAGMATTALVLTNSVVVGNVVGLRADTSSAIVVGGSTIASNGTNLVASGGDLYTWGNNYQVLNGTTNAFNFSLPLQ